MERLRDRSSVREARIAWTAIVLSALAILLTIGYVFRTVETHGAG